MSRRLSFVLALAAAALVAPTVADAAEQRLTFTYGPVKVAGHGVSQSSPAVLIDSPKVDGYVTGMSVEIVDQNGRVQGDDEVMLHHVVFLKVGAPDMTCPGPAERFWAKGEEEVARSLPTGYGYANRATDRWALVYMLMNHSRKPLTAHVRYTVKYETAERLTPVKPLWLDARNCRLDPVFDAPGTGGRGSTHTETADYRMPESGRLIAGGGHLHGGGIRLELQNATCGTTPFVSLPTWGGPEPLPLLHEPGPVKMSSFSSATGIPVAAGDTLRLVTVYDNSLPHTRAMGIMLLWFAPSPLLGCQPTPALNVDLGQPSAPPRFTMPLPRQPRGPLYRNVTKTWVGDYKYGHERVSVRRGTRFVWRFIGAVPHDVTLVRGPEGFSSPALTGGKTYSRRLTRRGTYDLFCSLHPTRMTQRIVVR